MIPYGDLIDLPCSASCPPTRTVAAVEIASGQWTEPETDAEAVRSPPKKTSDTN
jgi:hypothetical protein